jgi:hypothetical protein
MQFRRLVFLALLIFAQVLRADSLPVFGQSALLSDANVLRMKPPFETRYYFTFQTGSKQSATVIHDIYYSKDGYDKSKNRVIVKDNDHREFPISRSNYPALYQRLPKSLILTENASIGISLQDCVSSYSKLLADLERR